MTLIFIDKSRNQFDDRLCHSYNFFFFIFFILAIEAVHIIAAVHNNDIIVPINRKFYHNTFYN